ncbi:MAG: C39 family peptidase [Candidatus Shapirobacteria bacterium]|jgi:hypothetical protein
MLKKTLIISFLFLVFLSLFLIFPKKITKEKVENKVSEISASLSREVAPTQSETEGLDSKHLIKTAFIEQAPEKNWDQPWQDTCEEAALLTVDYFYKNQSPNSETVKNDILKMIDFENQKSFTKDINIDQMSLVSEKYLGYSTIIINNPTIDDIKKYLIKDIPVVIPANGKILYQENKHFNSGGPYYHNLTILGYDDTKNKFIVHDVGTQFGAYFHYSYSLLMKSIHDFPLSGKKEDINNGVKKILVLLK